MNKAMQEPVVYVTHCVDTEGPLDESLEATFDRLRNAFGIDLAATPENLEQIRAKAIASGDQAALLEMVDPHLLSYNRSWEQIYEMLERITSQAFRESLVDSYGNGWCYTWFCMDHVGYSSNPRRRAEGHHVVFDYYNRMIGRSDSRADSIQFHYHPLAQNGLAHASATRYLAGNHLYDILARKIIDRGWFPSVFRPGFHVTRPDSHWFLEQWFPYDFANQACRAENRQPDLCGGRFGDWRRAPMTWSGYHPDHDDYQRPGACRRWIFRCLNMKARHSMLEQLDVDDAFRQATCVGSSLLAFTNHDFRDMEPEIRRVAALIEDAAQRFPGVRFKFCSALEAARLHLGETGHQSPALVAELVGDGKEATFAELVVESTGGIFGTQPFLALKDRAGRYYYDNFDFTDSPNKWMYRFDWQTFQLDSLEAIGVAANGRFGETEVLLIDPAERTVTFRRAYGA